jgi:bacteriorhodopsin
MTVISWCTYPVVYLFPMLGVSAASAVVSIQIGYCASDIISKCGVGLVIYQISHAKSTMEKEGLEEPLAGTQ